VAVDLSLLRISKVLEGMSGVAVDLVLQRHSYSSSEHECMCEHAHPHMGCPTQLTLILTSSNLVAHTHKKGKPKDSSCLHACQVPVLRSVMLTSTRPDASGWQPATVESIVGAGERLAACNSGVDSRGPAGSQI
jgi:hypothetical protein